MATRKTTNKKTYMEPAEFIPKELRKKYGIGEYAPSNKPGAAKTPIKKK